MSISLPNGTILSAPSAPQLSAAVTRILHLTNFSPELKTRDIQLIFKEWENEKGGFRIKWLDDVNALVVFNDAVITKRAYLSLLLNPPASFPSPATIRPYDRPDAAGIIAQLTARTMGHRSSMSSAMSFSQANQNHIGISGLPESHGRAASISGGLSGFIMPLAGRVSMSASGSGSGSGFGAGAGAGTGSGAGHFSRDSASGSSAFGGIGSSSSGHATGNGHGNGSHGAVSGGTTAGPSAGSSSTAQRSRNLQHSRTGSASASASWTRGGGALGFGAGAGALNFPSSNSGRLATHSESSMDPSRSSSSEEDTIVIMDGGSTAAAARGFASGAGGGGGGGGGLRRDSMSAEKAMREVQKAMAQVETRG